MRGSEARIQGRGWECKANWRMREISEERGDARRAMKRNLTEAVLRKRGSL